ncbi:MAG: hypothetical protein U9R43_18490 [Thermodesulfobacteriota bacterium]|nr:hypothetical protein [Thermodesulfobacteriota bacterium]
MEAGIKDVMEELKVIRSELHTIREIMPDKDMFLTARESQLLRESYQNEKDGKLVSSAELRKELGIRGLKSVTIGNL